MEGHHIQLSTNYPKEINCNIHARNNFLILYELPHKTNHYDAKSNHTDKKRLSLASNTHDKAIFSVFIGSFL